MKTIKSGRRKKNILPLFWVFGVLFLPTGILICFLTDPTAKLEQNNMLTSCETVPLPVFSVPEGIYEQPFTLQIEAPAGYDIYYTTDGSIPSVHSLRYKKPITINPRRNLNRSMLGISTSYVWKPPVGKQNHSIVIRARCFKSNTGYGKIKNTIYSLSTIQQHQGFNVVHILMEADSLFCQKRGIYVRGEKYYSKKAYANDYKTTEEIMANESDILKKWLWAGFPANFLQRGKEWERPAEFILMNTAGKTLFEQNIRLRIHGGWSRVTPQKALRIIPDSIRGDAVFCYRFFDNLPYDCFKRILLRISGDDGTMFRDAMIHQIAKNLGLDIQDYTPAVVYINGNYWGIHNIRERMDENYLAIKYGADLQSINILEYQGDNKLFYGHPESLQSFKELINYIQRNALIDEKTYQHVCSQMDIDNFIDYMIVETFFANYDWGTNNMRWYRIDRQTETMTQYGVEAGKWRWMLIDMDYSIFTTLNMFERLKNDNKYHQLIVPLFFGLLENPDFKEKFLTRYKYVIHNYFTSEEILSKTTYFETLYESEIERHIARWRQIKSIDSWRGTIEGIKEFARKRPEIVLEQLEIL